MSKEGRVEDVGVRRGGSRGEAIVDIVKGAERFGLC